VTAFPHNGGSKAFAMTGWPAGYGAGPAKAALKGDEGCKSRRRVVPVFHQPGGARLAALLGHSIL